MAGDAGADQGLVADELEGKADQDRREGGEPRPLCYLPDGRGRHPTANVPGDFTAHRSWSPRAPRNCLHKTRKGANIHASSGAIWGILDKYIPRACPPISPRPTSDVTC